MWSWTAAEGGTLIDCATHGVKAGKFSDAADRVTVIGACAIIDCTDKAVKTLEAQKWTA
jgi:kynurenine formamidase